MFHLPVWRRQQLGLLLSVCLPRDGVRPFALCMSSAIATADEDENAYFYEGAFKKDLLRPMNRDYLGHAIAMGGAAMAAALPFQDWRLSQPGRRAVASNTPLLCCVSRTNYHESPADVQADQVHGEGCDPAGEGARQPRVLVAVGETVTLLHPPLPFLGVSTGIKRGRHQSDSLPDG